jgi:hypothetical protein
MATWYVDANLATGNHDGTDWTNAYATLSAAMVAKRGTLSEPCIFRCRATAGTADTAAVADTGMVTTPTNYVKIYVDQADRHAGVWDATKYRLSVTNANALYLESDDIWIDGLQIEVTANTAAYCNIYSLSDSRIDISNCILRGLDNAFYASGGILLSVVGTANIWNTFVYGFANGNATPICMIGAGTANVYSCVAISETNGYGILRSVGTLVCKNTYARAGTAYAFSGTMTCTNCASADHTADDHGGANNLVDIAYGADTFVNVTATTEDFHLAADGLSPLQGTGTNTTGDSAPLNFTTDIDGQTIGASWSIGADNIAGSGLSVFVYESTIVDEFNG